MYYRIQPFLKIKRLYDIILECMNVLLLSVRLIFIRNV